MVHFCVLFFDHYQLSSFIAFPLAAKEGPLFLPPDFQYGEPVPVCSVYQGFHPQLLHLWQVTLCSSPTSQWWVVQMYIFLEMMKLLPLDRAIRDLFMKVHVVFVRCYYDRPDAFHRSFLDSAGLFFSKPSGNFSNYSYPCFVTNDYVFRGIPHSNMCRPIYNEKLELSFAKRYQLS